MIIEEDDNGYIVIFKSVPNAYNLEVNAEKTGKSNTIRELTPSEAKFVMTNEIGTIRIYNAYDGQSFDRKVSSIIDCGDFFDLKIDENSLIMFCWSV